LVNTLDRIVKLIKKLRIKRAGVNDVMEKLIKSMSKLVLTATQAVMEKVTIVIRQMPIYACWNLAIHDSQASLGLRPL
jgi:hypothetical protein